MRKIRKIIWMFVFLITTLLYIGCGSNKDNEYEETIDNSDYYDESEENWITYPYSETTKESHGIKFTDNGDGSITINGIATENTSFYFVLPNTEEADITSFDEGTYMLTGGASDDCMLIFCYRKDGERIDNNQADMGNGVTFDIDPDSTEYNQMSCEIYIRANANMENVTIIPKLKKIISKK